MTKCDKRGWGGQFYAKIMWRNLWTTPNTNNFVGSDDSGLCSYPTLMQMMFVMLYQRCALCCGELGKGWQIYCELQLQWNLQADFGHCGIIEHVGWLLQTSRDSSQRVSSVLFGVHLKCIVYLNNVRVETITVTKHIESWSSSSSLSSSSSSLSSICHGVGPLVDPFRSHVSKSLFKDLP